MRMEGWTVIPRTEAFVPRPSSAAMSVLRRWVRVSSARFRPEWVAMPPTDAVAPPVRVSDRRRRLATTAVAFAFWITMLGTTVPTPLYPLYERALGFSSLMATVVFAVYAFGVVAGLLLFGRLSDQVGRRPVQLAALLLSVAAAVVFLLAQDLALLLTGRVLSGLSAALITGAASASLTELASSGPTELAPATRRARAGVLALAANMGGLACGTLLGGVIAQLGPAPLRLPWIAQGVLAIVALIGLATVPETAVPTAQVSIAPQRLHVPADIRGVFLRSALTAGAGFAGLGVLASMTGLFVAAELHSRNHFLAGLVVALAFLGTGSGQLLVRVLGARAALPLACIGLIIAAVLIAGALLATLLVPLLAASVIVGLATGVAVGDGVTRIATGVASERCGEVFSAFFVILYVMLAVPAVGVGVLTEACDLTTAGAVFAALVAALEIAVLARLVRSGNST